MNRLPSEGAAPRRLEVVREVPGGAALPPLTQKQFLEYARQLHKGAKANSGETPDLLVLIAQGPGCAPKMKARVNPINGNYYIGFPRGHVIAVLGVLIAIQKAEPHQHLTEAITHLRALITGDEAP